MRRYAGLVCVAAACASGQTSGITAPSSGFLVDVETHAIRPIAGLPGSSLSGPALPLGTHIRSAQFSWGGDYALAIAADPTSGPMLIRGLTSGAEYKQDLAGAISKVTRISLADNGSAALYTANAKQLQFVTGLPAAPVCSAPIDLSAIAGTVSAVAIGAQGDAALIAASDGTSGAVYEVAVAGGSVEKIADTPEPSAAVYLNGGRDLAFTDRSVNQLVLIEDIHGGRIATILAGPADGVDGPVALARIDGGLAVASAGSSNIIQYDLGARQVTATIGVPVAPSTFDRLTLPGVFAVNRMGTDPVYLYSPAQSRVWFVPPPVRSQP